MANIKSAKKRIKTIETARLRNRKVKATINTNIKKFQDLIAGKKVEEAKVLHATLISQLDNALAKNVYHKNNVARKKSALTKLLNSII